MEPGAGITILKAPRKQLENTSSRNGYKDHSQNTAGEIQRFLSFRFSHHTCHKF